jgi:hypothetical protein
VTRAVSQRGGDGVIGQRADDLQDRSGLFVHGRMITGGLPDGRSSRHDPTIDGWGRVYRDGVAMVND